METKHFCGKEKVVKNQLTARRLTKAKLEEVKRSLGRGDSEAGSDDDEDTDSGNEIEEVKEDRITNRDGRGQESGSEYESDAFAEPTSARPTALVQAKVTRLGKKIKLLAKVLFCLSVLPRNSLNTSIFRPAPSRSLLTQTASRLPPTPTFASKLPPPLSKAGTPCSFASTTTSASPKFEREAPSHSAVRALRRRWEHSSKLRRAMMENGA
jgi:hypothetical protein